jgi:hypothetical protein
LRTSTSTRRASGPVTCSRTGSATPTGATTAGRALAFVERTFGGDTPKEKGLQWGAITISEQVEYRYKMGSHTARFASVLALWYERTGDEAAREKAFRSFNWASYMCDRRGVVRVGPTEQSFWFSDGYGDYIRHFMAGLSSVPEWAPDPRRPPPGLVLSGGRSGLRAGSGALSDLRRLPARRYSGSPSSPRP